jgi:hypothetical protein
MDVKLQAFRMAVIELRTPQTHSRNITRIFLREFYNLYNANKLIFEVKITDLPQVRIRLSFLA